MKKYSLFIVLAFLFSCVDDFNHKDVDITITNPDISDKTEISFSQLYHLHTNEIGKDTVVMGYVVSSDQQGNFYKEIFVQNTLDTEDLGTENPRMGMRIRVGLTTTSTKYAKGRKIVVNLEGLKKTTSDDLLTLGKPSNTYIKDISEFDLDTHIYKMNEIGKMVPKTISLSDLSTNDLNTLVKVENVHFQESQIGISFAGLSTDDFDGKRTLEYCSRFRKDTIVLETSNFADFASEEIPNSQLNITAIYNISFDNEPILILNEFKDLEETGTYVNCETSIPNILITEVADPENASFSRYVELYNAENIDVNLKGWNLNRFVNGGSKSNISLDELIIPAKGFVIIANDKVSTESNFSFEESFGFSADLVNSKLDGNGDDAYTLSNATGELIDIFGVVTENGTDTSWEYEDGRAFRNIDIVEPNSIFLLEEWYIIKGNQNVPNDFTPNERVNDKIIVDPVIDNVETALLLITEVADPKQETKARFVEIYNPTDNNVSLNDWTLVRYNYTTSKNTKELAALPISLEQLVIPANDFVIVARDEAIFKNYFDETIDIVSSNLAGNGDDAYELIDPFGIVIDVYGDSNNDGSSSDWEYTDGFSKRKLVIDSPNVIFDITEWEVKQDQEASINYNPRVR